MKPNGWEVGWAAQRVTGEQSNGRPWVSFGIMTYVLLINLHTGKNAMKTETEEGEEDTAQLYPQLRFTTPQ